MTTKQDSTKRVGGPKRQAMRTARPKAARYPDEIRDAVKLATALRGAKAGGSAADHLAVRTYITEQLRDAGQDVTPATIAQVCGVSTVAALRRIAKGEAASTPLKPVGEALKARGASKWAFTPKLAAAAAAVWADQVAKGQK